MKARTRPPLHLVAMSLSITHLGTGSRGNCTLLESVDAKILIDQGFSGAQLKKRLGILGITPEEIDCIVISHHHGDHGGGARVAQNKWDIPVIANERTVQELGLDPMKTQYFESLDIVKVGADLSILTVPVPHAGADNVAFIISHGQERAAIITDLGSWTDELIQHVRGCEHISVEANYDNNRLMNGPYPYSLKERISGRGGHLSNDQTGEFLSMVCTEKTRSITLTHLSERNNQPHLAESTVLYHIGDVFDGDIHVSSQDGPEITHFIGKDAPEQTQILAELNR